MADDMLKMSIVLVVGIAIGYCSSYILPEERKPDYHDQILLFDIAHIKNSKTNLVLNIPIVRIGSGIRWLVKNKDRNSTK